MEGVSDVGDAAVAVLDAGGVFNSVEGDVVQDLAESARGGATGHDRGQRSAQVLPTFQKVRRKSDKSERQVRHFRYFSHIETYEVSDLLELSAELTEVVKQDSVRSTPIAARGKPRLHFILSNKV